MPRGGLLGELIAHPGWLLATLWGGAALCLYFSVRYWRLAHAIADTARARVRSAPHGYVELYGEAHCAPDAKQAAAPLSGRRCVWWSYRIERRAGRGWCRTDSATSDAAFVLQDETGSCRIDPRGALVTPGARQVWYGSEDWPRAPYSTGLGVLGSAYRYTEQRIQEHEGVCVLGELATVGGVAAGNVDFDVATLLHDWKSQPAALLARFDLDRDGELNAAEWEQARSAARAEVLAREASEPVVKSMGKPTDGRPYVLAAKDPRRLVRGYRWQAAASLIGFFVAVLILSRTHWPM